MNDPVPKLAQFGQICYRITGQHFSSTKSNKNQVKVVRIACRVRILPIFARSGGPAEAAGGQRPLGWEKVPATSSRPASKRMAGPRPQVQP